MVYRDREKYFFFYVDFIVFFCELVMVVVVTHAKAYRGSSAANFECIYLNVSIAFIYVPTYINLLVVSYALV